MNTHIPKMCVQSKEDFREKYKCEDSKKKNAVHECSALMGKT